MTKLTLQINSLEALERLIGGNSEVEIEIRSRVVQEFSKRHLKAVATSLPMQQKLAEINASILKASEERIVQEFGTFKKDVWGKVVSVKLDSTLATEISTKVRELLTNEIRIAVDEAIKFWSSGEALQRMINERVEYFTKQFVNDEIKKRIAGLLK